MVFKSQKKLSRRMAIGLATLGLTLLTALLPALHPRQQVEFGSYLATSLVLPFSPQVAQAQRFDPSMVWQQVYQQIDLPLENQYISRETGEVVEDNTLVDRFIRYHIYIQGRAPIYRLDWKLTMADYLGANEFISASTYPSSDTLTVNPMEGDMAAIQRLSRSERDALIQTIVDIFRASYTPPNSPTAAPTPDSPTDSTPAPSQPTTPRSTPSIRTPQPGDADLLQP
jgi:hypothetical protein